MKITSLVKKPNTLQYRKIDRIEIGWLVSQTIPILEKLSNVEEHYLEIKSGDVEFIIYKNGDCIIALVESNKIKKLNAYFDLVGYGMPFPKEDINEI